jgi:hypothetical protein
MNESQPLQTKETPSVEAWIESVQTKTDIELLRDQAILLNAINQNLYQMLRIQAKIQSDLNALTEMQQDGAEVQVSDVNIPYTSMVLFLLKWWLAAIPAALTLALLTLLGWLLLGELGWVPRLLPR